MIPTPAQDAVSESAVAQSPGPKGLVSSLVAKPNRQCPDVGQQALNTLPDQGDQYGARTL